jgi:uncharacterized protein (DUF58 family)
LKSLFNRFYKNLFLCSRLFIGLGCSALLFLLGFFFPWLGVVPLVFFWLVVILFLIDVWMLYRLPKGVFVKRIAPERLSNGDENELSIYVESYYPFAVDVELIDEIPHQFQKRDVLFKTALTSRQHKLLNYVLRPTKRGENSKPPFQF